MGSSARRRRARGAAREGRGRSGKGDRGRGHVSSMQRGCDSVGDTGTRHAGGRPTLPPHCVSIGLQAHDDPGEYCRVSPATPNGNARLCSRRRHERTTTTATQTTAPPPLDLGRARRGRRPRGVETGRRRTRTPMCHALLRRRRGQHRHGESGGRQAPCRTGGARGRDGTTDVIGILSDTEIALVLMPLESVLAGQHRVHALDEALRANGIVAAIGWAMRQDGHGLFHASARADAALASARRQRGVDLR